MAHQKKATNRVDDLIDELLADHQTQKKFWENQVYSNSSPNG